jgi:hypothetical protein
VFAHCRGAWIYLQFYLLRRLLVRHPRFAIRDRPAKARPALEIRAAFSWLAPFRRSALYAECLLR